MHDKAAYWLIQGHNIGISEPRRLCRCTVCDTQAVGDELHCVFDCPHFSEVWPVPRCSGVHAFVHVAQVPEVCQPLSHCLAAKGPDMNSTPSS